MKVKSNRIKLLKIFLTVAVVAALFAISAVTVFAAGDVSSAIESTWTAAQTQIKHGQFEFTAPAILFGCLVFSLTAPLYIWTVLG